MSTAHNQIALRQFIKDTAKSLGFASIAVSQPELAHAKSAYLNWLAQDYHGEMGYLSRNIDARFTPEQLVPNTLSIISVALPYLAAELDDDWQKQMWQTIAASPKATISRYALGRDYHKVVRSRLQQLASQLAEHIAPTPLLYRVFSDSAPVPEVEIAQQTSLGWRGKHTLLLNREYGSMFFLGDLYLNLDLLPDEPSSSHCGSCSACIDICPTQAIIAPYRIDARRCISYLTIEYSGQIPHEFRKAIGNRIYGCDDCQLVCPWNKFAQKSALSDFSVRHHLTDVSLLELLAWTEQDFKERMAGSAIYRIGHVQWQRNILLSLGNSDYDEQTIFALNGFINHINPILVEQAKWSIAQQLESKQKKHLK